MNMMTIDKQEKLTRDNLHKYNNRLKNILSLSLVVSMLFMVSWIAPDRGDLLDDKHPDYLIDEEGNPHFFPQFDEDNTPDWIQEEMSKWDDDDLCND